MLHRGLRAVHEHAEKQRVDGCPHGLVEQPFNEGVAFVETRFDERAERGFAIESLFVRGGGGGDGFLRGGDVVGWEGGFKEFLPSRRGVR